MSLRSWVGPALFLIIAFIGESILHDAPDWLIFLVAIAAGLFVGGLMRLIGPRR